MHSFTSTRNFAHLFQSKNYTTYRWLVCEPLSLQEKLKEPDERSDTRGLSAGLASNGASGEEAPRRRGRYPRQRHVIWAPGAEAPGDDAEKRRRRSQWTCDTALPVRSLRPPSPLSKWEEDGRWGLDARRRGPGGLPGGGGGSARRPQEAILVKGPPKGPAASTSLHLRRLYLPPTGGCSPPRAGLGKAGLGGRGRGAGPGQACSGPELWAGRGRTRGRRVDRIRAEGRARGEQGEGRVPLPILGRSRRRRRPAVGESKVVAGRHFGIFPQPAGHCGGHRESGPMAGGETQRSRDAEGAQGERERRRESSPGGAWAAAAPPPPPASHSLTHSHARVAAAASSPEPAPTPAPPRCPGPGRGPGRGLAGHIRLTIGKRNYRAYGNHGLGLLLLNSELSPAASLLCPAPPQRRTDRRLRPHCAGAPVLGILGAVVPAAFAAALGACCWGLGGAGAGKPGGEEGPGPL